MVKRRRVFYEDYEAFAHKSIPIFSIISGLKFARYIYPAYETYLCINTHRIHSLARDCCRLSNRFRLND